ncbi:MAG TPA: nuclear transport factor 2 family protein [Dyella sp.]|nr:nuclear transport factor 2 family protein [Dyella sp.]
MGSQSKQAQTATEVVSAAIDALNEGNAEAFLGSFSDDLHFRMPGTTPVSCETRGLAAFTKVVTDVAGYLEVLITIRVTNFISCGDWVVTESVGHGVTKKGQSYDNNYCHLWHVKDGKIDKFTEYNDTDLILRVLCA